VDDGECRRSHANASGNPAAVPCGRAPTNARVRCRLTSGVVTRRIGRYIDVSILAAGKDLCATCARFGGDVLEGFHLHGQNSTAFFEHTYASGGGLYDERSQHAREQWNERSRTESEDE
jgi:hypothetical protein